MTQGIPAYIASGLHLQFCLIRSNGTVGSAGGVLDLGSCNGRFDALCCLIQCYRLLALLADNLPPIQRRIALWMEERRGEALVMLRPGGARMRQAFVVMMRCD